MAGSLVCVAGSMGGGGMAVSLGTIAGVSGTTAGTSVATGAVVSVGAAASLGLGEGWSLLRNGGRTSPNDLLCIEWR